jgi:hypothetical protein
MSDGNLFEGIESKRQLSEVERQCNTAIAQVKLARLETVGELYGKSKWAKWMAGGERKVVRGVDVPA